MGDHIHATCLPVFPTFFESLEFFRFEGFPWAVLTGQREVPQYDEDPPIDCTAVLLLEDTLEVL